MNESFDFYENFAEALDDLPAEQYKKAVQVLCRYALHGEEPENLDGPVKMFFIMARPWVGTKSGRSNSGRPGRKGNGRKEKDQLLRQRSQNEMPVTTAVVTGPEASSTEDEDQCLPSEEPDLRDDDNLNIYNIYNNNNINNTPSNLKNTLSPPPPFPSCGESETADAKEERRERRKEREQEADDLFETLWRQYPRKKGKGQVSKAQKSRLLKIGLDEMSRCVSRFKDAMAGKEEQYVMYGSTFFNSGYVDYLDENYCGNERASPDKGSAESEDMLLGFNGDDPFYTVTYDWRGNETPVDFRKEKQKWNT